MTKAGNVPYDRSQNMGPNCGIVLDFLDSPEPPETVVGCCVGIYALNSTLVNRRQEMGMEIGSTKKNRCRKCGLPVESPLALFWDCKNSPNLYEMDHKCPFVLA